MGKLIIALLLGIAIGTSGTAVAGSIWRDKTMDADASNGGSVLRYDDNRYQVKCWKYKAGYAGGISCLPWNEIKQR